MIGAGLEQNEWGKNALRLAENCNKPMLQDTDAFNLLAIDPHKRQNRVLIPRPSEATGVMGGAIWYCRRFAGTKAPAV